MIMPDDKNYGYWTDNNLKVEDFEKQFKTNKIQKAEFDKWVNSFEMENRTDANNR